MTAPANPMNPASPARALMLATVMLLSLGTAAHGQSMRAAGSIGVSLTILQPIATQPVRVVGFDVDRNGLATLQTTSPTSAPVSQIVMTGVSPESSVAGSAKPVSTLVPASSRTATVRYVVDLGASRAGESRPPMQLRLQYLTVAGT